MARHLAAALDARRWSRRTAADQLGINRQTIGDVIDGRTWPDVATIARLEAGLNTELWPPLARRQLRNHLPPALPDSRRRPQ
ncbi:helix-turn-helix transcriptional regulator [Streptomyces sp. SID14515]|uniref:helix-turn-helix transcriptional regulator n=1 Tax=Streptomyces sp. SID14515 TaxID=2706074 RepID=UPI0031BA38E8